jgi:predicted HTH transcriptional regulator
VERTISSSNGDKFAQAVCAFANDFPAHRQPGYLLIGVKDDGELSGLKVTDDLLQTLGALRSDGNIQPMPALTVTRFSLPGGDVAVVEVLPADLPPVRYKGRVYIRVGPRRATATEQEERILTERRISHARTFDALPCLDSSLADLSEDRFRLTYPRVALRELLLNAVVHRNYQSTAPIRFYCFPNHITINNPGGLYGDATAESFPRTTGYRNPIIAEATRVLGYTNRFGQGIARTTKALELNGNPPAEYQFDAHRFTVTLTAKS